MIQMNFVFCSDTFSGDRLKVTIHEADESNVTLSNFSMSLLLSQGQHEICDNTRFVLSIYLSYVTIPERKRGRERKYLQEETQQKGENERNSKNVRRGGSTTGKSFSVQLSEDSRCGSQRGCHGLRPR